MKTSMEIMVVMDYVTHVDGEYMRMFGCLYPDTTKVLLRAIDNGFNPELSETLWEFIDKDDNKSSPIVFRVSAIESVLLGPPFVKSSASKGDHQINEERPEFGESYYEMKSVFTMLEIVEKLAV